MIYLAVFLVYLGFSHIMCKARNGTSLFFTMSSLFLHLEALQNTILNCIPAWFHDFRNQFGIELEKVKQNVPLS